MLLSQDFVFCNISVCDMKAEQLLIFSLVLIPWQMLITSHKAFSLLQIQAPCKETFSLGPWWARYFSLCSNETIFLAL